MKVFMRVKKKSLQDWLTRSAPERDKVLRRYLSPCVSRLLVQGWVCLFLICCIRVWGVFQLSVRLTLKSCHVKWVFGLEVGDSFHSYCANTQLYEKKTFLRLELVAEASCYGLIWCKREWFIQHQEDMNGCTYMKQHLQESYILSV